jgi:prepilin peptidase CpaA
VLLLVAYAVLAPISGVPLQEIALSTAMATGTLVIGIACFACGWMGGGDAKLASVAALWFGLSHTFDFLLCTALFGCALTLLVLAFRRLTMPASLVAIPWIQRLHAASGGIPYGVAMAAAVLATIPQTHWAVTVF